MSAEPLPEYRVKARNTSARSENKIHDDAVARQYGFAGGLVPGVTVYAYATEPVVRALGSDWLARGTASVRFVRPVIEGEEVLVTASLRRDGEPTVEASVLDPRGQTCAVLTATVPAHRPEPPDPADYAPAALPAERPEASHSVLVAGRVLGSPAELYDEAAALAFLEEHDAHQVLYEGGAGVTHPAFYLRLANRSLTANVRVSPWIHAGSAVQHLALARVGEQIEARGRVAALYEKKGREMVDLDLLMVAGEAARPIARIRHSAIWRLPPGRS